MNRLKNKVQLIGNVGQDPLIKTLENGKKVVRFSLATNSQYKTDGEEIVKTTDWHSIVAWGKTAEILGEYVRKGSQIALEGKLTSHSYDDKAGVKQYVTEVVIYEFLMLDKNEPAKSTKDENTL